MSDKLISLIIELKNKIEAIKLDFEKFFKYPYHKVYRDKSYGQLKELREIQLRISRVFSIAGKSEFRRDIKTIISLLDLLLAGKPQKREFFGNVRSLELVIQEVEINLREEPNDFDERIYDKGSRFDFYLDVKSILNKSETEIFIVDSWVNENILEIYLKNLGNKINLRVLTGINPKGKLVAVANLYNSQFNNLLEIRESPDIHDRGIFCDDKEGWVMGQSIKDGAKKPTYLIKLKHPNELKDIYEKIWQQGKKIV